MKKIVPFNNVLDFNTDVKEITAISLEHNINKYPDMISGVFYVSGEYKITEGLLDTEKFNFELPFDIALSNNYRTDSLLVDIDDFRYELISDKSLKVNIDLYIDGEVEEPVSIDINQTLDDVMDREDNLSLEEDLDLNEEECDLVDEVLKDEKESNEEEKEEDDDVLKSLNQVAPERIDLLKEMLDDNKEELMMEDLTNNQNENINNNIFVPNGDEKYVTYRVYKVLENDTIDTILTKYGITKEMLGDYNNIENIKPGDKLIIPTNEK